MRSSTVEEMGEERKENHLAIVVIDHTVLEGLLILFLTRAAMLLD